MPKVPVEKMVSVEFLHSKISNVTKDAIQSSLIELRANLSQENTEENNKAFIRDFIRDIGFKKQKYTVASKDKYDLAIYNRKGIYVLIETKKINSSEMITEENLNKKAFQESLLYFMREFVNNHNHALTYSIITDGVNWFIFDVNNVFKTLFAEDKKFLADYKAAQIDKSSLDTKTNEFYENIARPQIATVSDKIEYVHFNLSDMFTQKDTIKWNVVNKFYKIMAPVTLMKKTFSADPNELDKGFYDELMHILGLQEKNYPKELKDYLKISVKKDHLSS